MYAKMVRSRTRPLFLFRFGFLTSFTSENPTDVRAQSGSFSNVESHPNQRAHTYTHMRTDTYIHTTCKCTYCMYLRVSVPVHCVCGWVGGCTYIHINIYIWIHINIHSYIQKKHNSYVHAYAHIHTLAVTDSHVLVYNKAARALHQILVEIKGRRDVGRGQCVCARTMSWCLQELSQATVFASSVCVCVLGRGRKGDASARDASSW